MAREQAFYALLFLYGKVLKLPLGDIAKIADIPHAKRDKHLPTVLDRQQVLSVIGAIEDSPWCPYRLMACLLFGCGLRVSEVLNLRIKDVSITESRLVIRNTKGRSDRHVPLPCCVQVPLQRQLDRVKLLWQEDRERRLPASMPGLDGLRRKFPSYPFALGWQYVFPQQTPCPNPQAWPGEEQVFYRHHQHMSSLQKAVRAASVRCDLDGVVTPHAFRHAFASQLEWSGEHLTTIQRLLGHKNIETTMDLCAHPRDHGAQPLGYGGREPICIARSPKTNSGIALSRWPDQYGGIPCNPAATLLHPTFRVNTFYQTGANMPDFPTFCLKAVLLPADRCKSRLLRQKGAIPR